MATNIPAPGIGGCRVNCPFIYRQYNSEGTLIDEKKSQYLQPGTPSGTVRDSAFWNDEQDVFMYYNVLYTYPTTQINYRPHSHRSWQAEYSGSNFDLKSNGFIPVSTREEAWGNGSSLDIGMTGTKKIYPKPERFVHDGIPREWWYEAGNGFKRFENLHIQHYLKTVTSQNPVKVSTLWEELDNKPWQLAYEAIYWIEFDCPDGRKPDTKPTSVKLPNIFLGTASPPPPAPKNMNCCDCNTIATIIESTFADNLTNQLKLIESLKDHIDQRIKEEIGIHGKQLEALMIDLQPIIDRINELERNLWNGRQQ